MKKKICVVFGGRSSEYKISLMSAAEVIRNIDREKYELLTVGATPEGDFYLYEGDESSIENDSWREKTVTRITFSVNRKDHGFIRFDTGETIRVDLVFPVMHGRNGEDGRLQGLLELAGIPCAGCGMTASAVCMDKHLCHSLAKANGLEVPEGRLFKNTDSLDYIFGELDGLKYPLFVKPLKAGSSIGVTEIKEHSELKIALGEAFKYDSNAIVEERIDGFEVGCAVLGDITGETDEIELENGVFDFYEKYHLSTSKIHLPTRIPKSERERIKNFARKIYDIMGCKGFARVDMFYTPDKRIVFNEVNTIPGFTLHSRFPKMLGAAGISFGEVVERAIELGLKERNEDND